MSDPSTLRWPVAIAALALSSAALLAACGGGGASDPTSGPTTPSATATASYAQGPIDGFGSIIVGGIRFDESAAEVTDEDGVRQAPSKLKLGTMVQVDATPVDAAASAAKAHRVRFGHEVVGPVSAVDKAAATMTVLGQTVLVTASTVFDDSLSGGFDAVTIGMVVEVHGLRDSTNNRIVATRIEPEAAATAYLLRGVVAELNTTTKTFKIGSETINYAGVAAVPAALANGVIVRVQVQTVQVGSAWVATRLAMGPRLPDAGLPARVHGIVTAVTSPTSFELNGLKVDAGAATFEPTTLVIALGARLEVYGSVKAGVLVATKVESDDGSRGGMGGKRPLELHGMISGLATDAKTFALRGLTVSYAGAVEYKNGNAAGLANGRAVEVKGVLSADRTRLDATRIEFE